MKPAEIKNEFVRLRAENYSFAKIQEKLGISKSTCSKWEHELIDQIASYKAEQLQGLYDAYSMTKEARIKKIGDTVNRLETALDNVDLSELPPDKLLDFYLKYKEALQSEYIAPVQPIDFSNRDTKALIDAVGDLVNRVRAGEITKEQATRESTAITILLKAYETNELKQKVDSLEALLEAR